MFLLSLFAELIVVCFCCHCLLSWLLSVSVAVGTSASLLLLPVSDLSGIYPHNGRTFNVFNFQNLKLT